MAFTDNDSADVITTDTTPQTTQESTYAIADHMKAARKLYGYNAALVQTALQMAGKDSYTVTEAKQIIDKFANTPVD